MGMNDCKQVKNPMDPGSHFIKVTEDKKALDQQSYQSLVGSLSTCKRSDIGQILKQTQPTRLTG